MYVTVENFLLHIFSTEIFRQGGDSPQVQGSHAVQHIQHEVSWLTQKIYIQWQLDPRRAECEPHLGSPQLRRGG